MRAVVRSDQDVQLSSVPAPRLGHAADVLVRVVVAGVCRTDLQAARGLLACRPPRILGHELAGVVTAVGPAVAGLVPGDRVTAMPLLPCRTCSGCSEAACCHAPRMLGVDTDGGFADHVRLPASCVYRVPDTMPFRLAAYAEPVCAALGILEAGLDPGARGLILGTGRLAALLVRVLEGAGFQRIEARAPDAELDGAGYDFAVETDPGALDRALRALARGGTLVLKSRPASPVTFDLRAAVLRDLTLRGIGYGAMNDAIDLLAAGRLQLDDLLGPVRPLEEFEQVFAEAERSEGRKLFLAMSAEAAD